MELGERRLRRLIIRQRLPRLAAIGERVRLLDNSVNTHVLIIRPVLGLGGGQKKRQ